jgi:hypothetical protein
MPGDKRISTFPVLILAWLQFLNLNAAAQNEALFFYSPMVDSCEWGASNTFQASNNTGNGGLCAYVPLTNRLYACPAPDPYAICHSSLNLDEVTDYGMCFLEPAGRGTRLVRGASQRLAQTKYYADHPTVISGAVQTMSFVQKPLAKSTSASVPFKVQTRVSLLQKPNNENSAPCRHQ